MRCSALRKGRCDSLCNKALSAGLEEEQKKGRSFTLNSRETGGCKEAQKII